MADRHVSERLRAAEREIGVTTTRPSIVRVTIGLFVSTLIAVALVQHVVEIQRDSSDGTILDEFPHCYDVFDLLPSWHELISVRRVGDLLGLLPGLDEIDAYEAALEEDSTAGRGLLPYVQYALTGGLGIGNEEAYVGRGGWLFYRPDVEYLTGPGFLQTAQLAARRYERAAWADPPQSDPIQAILGFHQQLAVRGIRLAVMPTPSKATVHPEEFSSRYGRAKRAPRNPSYSSFVAALTAEGVWVIDVTETLLQAARETGSAAYLATDSHWAPAAMARAATQVADAIRPMLSSEHAPLEHRRTSVTIVNLGDTAGMLNLPDEQQLYPRERVTTNRVLSSAGEPWEPTRGADVLVLGDSFCNVYSHPGMGWGSSAGFIEHFSAALARPIDRIATNAGGSHTTRQRLARELARDADRLAGTRIVVYQFAMRELAFGDWKVFEMPGDALDRD
jgi:alginate O-acetyltransferase complex protein AlgJ